MLAIKINKSLRRQRYWPNQNQSGISGLAARSLNEFLSAAQQQALLNCQEKVSTLLTIAIFGPRAADHWHAPAG